MKQEIIAIPFYDKSVGGTGSIYVIQLSENTFKMAENDIFNCRLTYGTEFETKVNIDGNHELVKIVRKAKFITRRFFLNTRFKESEYRILGDEIMRVGGFWQTDFGGIATINLPKDSGIDIDEIFRIFDFHPVEIKD